MLREGERWRMVQGDCLEVMPTLPDGSVDMVCADPPYGTTACKWDSVIPLEPMWKEIRRVLKPLGAVVLTASQPFTTTLIDSNRRWFKYCWVWDKGNASGYLNAKVMPLQRHEDVVVFYRRAAAYRPQMRKGPQRAKGTGNGPVTECYRDHERTLSVSDLYYPTSVLAISNANRAEKEHPTQKPVELMRYLVNTYTAEGEVVLDFCAGSGTTGVACLLSGRRFLGIEKDATYCALAVKRLAETDAEPPLFAQTSLLDPRD